MDELQRIAVKTSLQVAKLKMSAAKADSLKLKIDYENSHLYVPTIELVNK